MADNPEEISNAGVRERDDGNTADANAPDTGDNAGELIALLRGLAGQLGRLEESQAELKSS
jgi:hypothetical protein